MANEDRRWRHYRVMGRAEESARIVSLELASGDDLPLAAFKAGQFLTFRLKDGQGRPVPRSYSLSGSPARLDRYRISVKRERDPGDPAAMGAPFRPDQAQIGDVLEASTPKGEFVLDPASPRPLLLVAGGVGIAPLVAMVHALGAGLDCQKGRKTQLVQVAPEAALLGFTAELTELARKNRALAYHPAIESEEGAFFARRDAEGQAHVKSWLADRPEIYLCGPSRFIELAYAALMASGARDADIHCEFFGPMTLIRQRQPA